MIDVDRMVRHQDSEKVAAIEPGFSCLYGMVRKLLRKYTTGFNQCLFVHLEVLSIRRQKLDLFTKAPRFKVNRVWNPSDNIPVGPTSKLTAS